MGTDWVHTAHFDSINEQVRQLQIFLSLFVVDQGYSKPLFQQVLFIEKNRKLEILSFLKAEGWVTQVKLKIRSRGNIPDIKTVDRKD